MTSPSSTGRIITSVIGTITPTMMSTSVAAPTMSVAAGTRKRMAPLVIGAIGVVFVDIGTSPLYTLRQCFTGTHRLSLAPENVLGILSIIFWSLVIVVTLKYVTLIMRADNRGEGGILALTALVSTALGVSAAVALNRMPSRHAQLMISLFLSPLIVPVNVSV